MSELPAYADLNNPGNGPDHRTGKPCIVEGCTEEAGTAWSPHWCPQHNIERMSRITRQLRAIVKGFGDE